MEAKAGIKVILQSFDPLHLLRLSKRKAGIKALQDGVDPCFPLCLLSSMGLSKGRGKGSKQSHGCIRGKGMKMIMQSRDSFDPFPPTLAKPHLDFLILG